MPLVSGYLACSNEIFKEAQSHAHAHHEYRHPLLSSINLGQHLRMSGLVPDEGPSKCTSSFTPFLVLNDFNTLV